MAVGSSSRRAPTHSEAEAQRDAVAAVSAAEFARRLLKAPIWRISAALGSSAANTRRCYIHGNICDHYKYMFSSLVCVQARRTEGTEIIKGTLTTRGRPNTRPRSMSEGGWHGPAKVLSEPVTLTLSGRGSTRTSLKSLLSLRRFSRTRPPVATLTWAGGGRSLSLPRSACMAGQYVGGLRAVVAGRRPWPLAPAVGLRRPTVPSAARGPSKR